MVGRLQIESVVCASRHARRPAKRERIHVRSACMFPPPICLGKRVIPIIAIGGVDRSLARCQACRTASRPIFRPRSRHPAGRRPRVRPLRGRRCSAARPVSTVETACRDPIGEPDPIHRNYFAFGSLPAWEECAVSSEETRPDAAGCRAAAPCATRRARCIGSPRMTGAPRRARSRQPIPAGYHGDLNEKTLTALAVTATFAAPVRAKQRHAVRRDRRRPELHEQRRHRPRLRDGERLRAGQPLGPEGQRGSRRRHEGDLPARKRLRREQRPAPTRRAACSAARRTSA